MFGFLLGLAAGTALMCNGPRVRRGLAVMLVTGEDVVASTAKQARRISAQISEDLEDIVAEAREAREAQTR